MAPSDQKHRYFLLQCPDHCMESGCNQEPACSDVGTDLLRIHFLMIPPYHFFVFHTGINCIADGKVIIPWLLTVDSCTVCNNQHIPAVLIQLIDKICHDLLIINAQFVTFFLYNRTDRKTDYLFIKKRIILNFFFYLFKNLWIICHCKCSVCTKFYIFFNTDLF